MSLETLKIFVTVVEQSHFSRAAEKLNLSQPGVSMHIRNLEDEFGTKLLHRTSKQVTLTESGRILYHKAKQILYLYEEAKDQLSLLRNEVMGSLRIGASFTIGEYVLPRLLAVFTQQYPQVEVGVTIANTKEIAQAIHTNELDLGLVEGDHPHPELLIHPAFMDDEMVIIAPRQHPLCSMGPVDPIMLHDHVWVFREAGSGTRACCEKFVEQYHLRIERSYIFNSNQGVKEAVIAGLGLSMLSTRVVRQELESGVLCEIAVKGTRVIRQFHLLQNSSSSALEMAAMKKLIKTLQSTGQNH